MCSRSCEIVIFGLGDACGVRNRGELFHSRMMLAHSHAIFWEKLSLRALWNEWIRVSSTQIARHRWKHVCTAYRRFNRREILTRLLIKSFRGKQMLYLLAEIVPSYNWSMPIWCNDTCSLYLISQQTIPFMKLCCSKYMLMEGNCKFGEGLRGTRALFLGDFIGFKIIQRSAQVLVRGFVKMLQGKLKQKPISVRSLISSISWCGIASGTWRTWPRRLAGLVAHVSVP